MANCDSLQEYIDSLKENLAKANDDFTYALNIETQDKNLLDKKISWSGFLNKILAKLDITDKLALNYIEVLERAVKQASKVAGNSLGSLRGLKILLCQLKQISDCTESLLLLAVQLKDRSNIPAKDGAIITDITVLKKAIDDSGTAITNAILKVLTAYQLQEELFKNLDGDADADRGIVKQLSWMQMQVQFAYSADSEVAGDCESKCKKQTAIIFPMANNRELYKKVKAKQNQVSTDIEEGSKKAVAATCEREAKQAKKDALQAALTAAEAARACDIKK